MSLDTALKIDWYVYERDNKRAKEAYEETRRAIEDADRTRALRYARSQMDAARHVA